MGVIEDSIVGETNYYGWERERRKPLGLRVPPGYWFSTAIGEVPISGMKLEHLKKALNYATRRRWVNKVVELRAEIKRRDEQRDLPKGFWMDAHGRVLDMREMAYVHLMNALMHCRRYGNRKAAEISDELLRRKEANREQVL